MTMQLLLQAPALAAGHRHGYQLLPRARDHCQHHMHHQPPAIARISVTAAGARAQVGAQAPKHSSSATEGGGWGWPVPDCLPAAAEGADASLWRTSSKSMPNQSGRAVCATLRGLGCEVWRHSARPQRPPASPAPRPLYARISSFSRSESRRGRHPARPRSHADRRRARAACTTTGSRTAPAGTAKPPGRQRGSSHQVTQDRLGRDCVHRAPLHTIAHRCTLAHWLAVAGCGQLAAATSWHRMDSLPSQARS
jgi:hypothetical protein